MSRHHEQFVLEVICPTCNNVRAFYPAVDPDPQDVARRRAQDDAAAWYRSHPCSRFATQVKPAQQGAT